MTTRSCKALLQKGSPLSFDSLRGLNNALWGALRQWPSMTLRQFIDKPTTSSIVLLIFLTLSCCQKTLENKSNLSSHETEDTSRIIDIRRSEGNQTEEADYKEIIVRLENNLHSKSMNEAVYMVDEKSGQRYRVHNFKEILGVRSSNEESYVLKIYSDHSLYGIDPVYEGVPCLPLDKEW